MITSPALHALVCGTAPDAMRRVGAQVAMLYPSSRVIECPTPGEALAQLDHTIFDLVVLVLDSASAGIGPVLTRLRRHETPMPVCLLIDSACQDELIGELSDLDPDWELGLYDRGGDAYLSRCLRLAISRHELKWERDHLQRAFQSSLLQYRNLFDEVPDLIFLCDRSGCLLDVNATVERVFGVKREAVLHRPIFEAFGIAEADFRGLVERATNGEGPIKDSDVKYRAADGRVVYGLTHMIARREGASRPIQFQGVIKDITPRKLLESQLRDHGRSLEHKVSERTQELMCAMNFLNGILDGATEYAIFGLDARGTFVHFNRGAQLILQYTPDEVVGRRRLDDIIRFPEGEFDGLDRLLETVDRDRVLVREVVVRAGGDRDIAMHMTLNRLGEVGSAALAYVGIARDVTEQKEMEELLKVYTENLESVVEEKSAELEQKHIELIQSSKLATLGEMATGIAHEMNQPLSGIRTRAQLLMRLASRGALDAEKVLVNQREIMELVDRVGRIIHHMRVFARQDQQPFTAFHLADSVAGCLSLYSAQLRLHAIEVELSLDRKAPPILGETSQLEQVLLNLIINARDAMDERESRLVSAKGRGRYRKRLEIGLERRGRDEVRLWVADNGVGMSKEVCGRIFQPFWTTKSVGKGTGLGLSISHGIVGRHGGRIEVASVPGEGSTFSLYFPAVVAGRVRPAAKERESAGAIRETA
jgi:PAS domain S-box-containing protein